MHLVWIVNDLIPFLFLISNRQSWSQNVSVYRGILVTVVTKCQDNFIYLSPCMIGDITPQNRSNVAERKRERERYFPLENMMGKNMSIFHFCFNINKDVMQTDSLGQFEWQWKFKTQCRSISEPCLWISLFPVLCSPFLIYLREWPPLTTQQLKRQ